MKKKKKEFVNVINIVTRKEYVRVDIYNKVQIEGLTMGHDQSCNPFLTTSTWMLGLTYIH